MYCAHVHYMYGIEDNIRNIDVYRRAINSHALTYDVVHPVEFCINAWHAMTSIYTTLHHITQQRLALQCIVSHFIAHSLYVHARCHGHALFM